MQAGTTLKPNLVTDWDGTMKTYSSQYVTCMQPAADATFMLVVEGIIIVTQKNHQWELSEEDPLL